jgi:hypothetical protein
MAFRTFSNVRAFVFCNITASFGNFNRSRLLVVAPVPDLNERAALEARAEN